MLKSLLIIFLAAIIVAAICIIIDTYIGISKKFLKTYTIIGDIAINALVISLVSLLGMIIIYIYETFFL